MHAFIASNLDPTKCAHRGTNGNCGRILRDHTAIAQCEVCPKIGPCDIIAGDILACKACQDREAQLQAESKANAEQRVIDMHKVVDERSRLMDEAVKIDNSINLIQDIFNAKTIALAEVMKAINEDSSVENKPYARVDFAVNRKRHLQEVIFEQKRLLDEAQNELQVVQIYINNTLHELRDEERAKIKEQDINYPARPVGKTPKPKSAGTKKVATKVKVDMTEMNKWAARVNTTGTVLHMMMIQKGITAKQAAADWAKTTGQTNIDWTE